MHKDTLEEISRKLEPKQWRSTQRENARDYEHRATAGKWAAIISAIINFQNKHSGASPADHIIARDANLSVGQVGYHMKEMQKAKLIRELRGYPRVILVEQVAKVAKEITTPTEEIRRMKTKKSKRNYSGRASFAERAENIARKLDEYWNKYGTSPDGRWLLGQVYEPGAASGAIVPVLQRMTERGWIEHKPNSQAYKLTEEGRSTLLGEAKVVDHQQPELSRVSAPSMATPSIPRNVPPPTPYPEPQAIPPWEPEPVAFTGAPTGAATFTNGTDLYKVEDVDLVIELTSRGFKVHR